MYDIERGNTEKLESSVYPVNTNALLYNKTSGKGFEVFVDRPKGATFWGGKGIILFLSRSAVSNDGKGNDEKLQHE